MNTTPSILTRVLAFATIYLVWGTTYLGIRVADVGLPPFLMAALRFLAAGAVLYLMVCGRSPPRALFADWKTHTIVGLCLVGANAIVCWSEQSINSGLTALAIGVAPIFMVTWVWILPGGRAPTRQVCFGIVLGVTGLVLLFGPGAFAAGDRPPLLRVLAVFGSSAVWCLGSVYSKHAGAKGDALLGSALQMLVGGAAMLLVSFICGEWPGWHPAAVPASSWLALAYLVVAGSLIAFPTYIWLLKHETPARVSSYAYVNPAVALLAGWLVLHESFPRRSAFAVPVLLVGIAVITLGTGAPQRERDHDAEIA